VVQSYDGDCDGGYRVIDHVSFHMADNVTMSAAVRPSHGGVARIGDRCDRVVLVMTAPVDHHDMVPSPTWGPASNRPAGDVLG